MGVCDVLIFCQNSMGYEPIHIQDMAKCSLVAIYGFHRLNIARKRHVCFVGLVGVNLGLESKQAWFKS